VECLLKPRKADRREGIVYGPISQKMKRLSNPIACGANRHDIALFWKTYC